MESKKRKREVEAPRVTYDAATRTFDRLFKEDSLDAMKTVVRKKLGLSNSIPVYLSQWREGKAVDLEDNEDFEAFSAAARSSTAVVVKVVLGENQTLPLADENEVSPSTTKRKRKKKSKANGSASPPVTREPSVDNVNHDTFSEAVPAQKKRRVSFAEGAPDVRNLLGEKLKKKNSNVELGKSITPAVDATNTEPEQSEKEEEPVKKKKKKTKKNKVAEEQTEDSTEEQTKAVDGVPTTGTKSEKKSVANSEGTKAPSDNSTPGAATQPKKSKKRSRSSIGPEVIIQNETPATEQLAPATKSDDGERPTKKAKKKASDSVVSKSIAAVVDMPHIATSSSQTQLPTTQSPSVPETAIPEPTKKPRKRKQKPATGLDESTLSEAQEPNPADKRVEDASSSGKSKKSAKAGNGASSTEAIPEPTSIIQSIPPAVNKVTTSIVPVADEPENTPAVKKPKKSKQKAEAAKPTEATSSEPKDLPPPVGTGAQEKSKKSKDNGKDTVSPVVVVTEDNANVSVAPAAKTPKKAGKQKKSTTETVELPSTAEGLSLEDVTLTNLAHLDEAARMGVLSILKAAAEKNGNSNSPSIPAAVQPTPTQPQPTSSDSSVADKAPLHVAPASPLAARSTITEPPPKTAVAPENSKGVKKATLSKLAKEASKCPICENSPLHARSRCPVVKSGIRAMRKKISELEQETSEEGAESRSSVILELQGIIERRTKKPRVSEIIKPIAPPDAESASLEKEAEVTVATANVSTPPAPAPAPAPSTDSESPVEAESEVTAVPVPVPTSQPIPKRIPAPTPAAANPRSPPPSQPRFSITEKSAPLPVSSQVKSSQKTNAQGTLSQPKPRQIAEAPLPINLMGFGDVSLFTDQDLDALIRGPRLSVKNVVPTSDTEEESDQEEEAVLEEDVAVEDKSARNASRAEYPSSSDEGEEDEEEQSPLESPMGVDHPVKAAIIEEADVDGDVKESRGDLSFREINDLGSSVEPDRTADNVVHTVVGADIASLNVPGLSQDSGPKNDTEKRSDETESQASSSKNSPTPPEVTEDVNADPIEPSDVPPASQPEPIASDDDDEPPVESTPAVRTRSQRVAVTKKVAPKSSQPPTSQSKVNGSDEAQVGDAPKPRTRSLMKITELPIPPNPSARIIRQAAVATPRTRRQLAKEPAKEREVTPEDTEIAGRTRRAAVTAKAKIPAKVPAKTPAKATKTTAKPLSKQGKTVAANGVDDAKSKSGPGVVSSVQELESSQAPPSSPGKNSWAYLKSSAPSQVDETAGMVDELLSSPTAMANTSPSDHNRIGQKSMGLNGSQPEEPLFIPAESQQSFPYSQYPDAPPMTQGATSPNDSDDEEEVLAAVVKTKTGSTKQAFRSLKEIASQPSLFAPRLSQIMKPANEPEDEDLYGRKGRESEESDSGSDDSDNDRPASHIPASRRAGVSQPKKK